MYLYIYTLSSNAVLPPPPPTYIHTDNSIELCLMKYAYIEAREALKIHIRILDKLLDL